MWINRKRRKKHKSYTNKTINCVEFWNIIYIFLALHTNFWNIGWFVAGLAVPVSVAIMFRIIIDNCKIYTRTHMNQMAHSASSRECFACSSMWLLNLANEQTKGPYQKVFHTNTTSRSGGKSSAYAALDPVTLSFERWFRYKHHSYACHISSFTNVNTFPFALETRRRTPQNERTNERTEKKDKHILYLVWFVSFWKHPNCAHFVL